MERYVDAEALIEKINRLRINGLGNKHTEWHNAMWKCMDVIVQTPTANVREVIRCKDCKNANPQHHRGSVVFCIHHCEIESEDGFCNHAERRGYE